MLLFISKIIYSIGIGLYHLFIGIASPFNSKANSFTKGRLTQDIKPEKEKTIWFHCASLGEFEQAKPVINWCYNNLKYPIIITFYSPSGYNYRYNYALAKEVYYLPKDTALNAKNFVRKINPAFVFFIKYDFWFYYLNELKNQKIPTYLISAIFRDNQLFFKQYGVLHKAILNCFTHIFVQDDYSLNLLQNHQFNHCSIAKDTRFDTVKHISELNFGNDIIESFIDGNNCLIAGSTWAKDEVILKNIVKEFSHLKLIIVPHDVNEIRIKQIQKNFKNHTLLSNPIDVKDKKVLIIDSVGKLSLIYRYATLCYIGGGFNTSVHNVLEAAVYGKALIYGPNHTKSKEAIDLIRLNAAKCVTNSIELENAVSYFLDKNNNASAGSTASHYVQENTGGTFSIIKKLKEDKIIA
ncbi:MAG: 3-deoxy-D-manno-octulosonic acid transferase [Chitinophagales bacterium]|nr:3-deoxy-D-manno-octulosonic acid transferase [Chitinophagales bacterium]